MGIGGINTPYITEDQGQKSGSYDPRNFKKGPQTPKNRRKKEKAIENKHSTHLEPPGRVRNFPVA